MSSFSNRVFAKNRARASFSTIANAFAHKMSAITRVTNDRRLVDYIGSFWNQRLWHMKWIERAFIKRERAAMRTGVPWLMLADLSNPKKMHDEFKNWCITFKPTNGDKALMRKYFTLKYRKTYTEIANALKYGRWRPYNPYAQRRLIRYPRQNVNWHRVRRARQPFQAPAGVLRRYHGRSDGTTVYVRPQQHVLRRDAAGAATWIRR